LSPLTHLSPLAPRPFLLAAADINPAVQSGHDALSKGERFPWYDSGRDDLRAVPIASDDSSDNSSNDRDSGAGSGSGGGGSGSGGGSGAGSGSGSGGGAGSDSSPSRSSPSFNPQIVSAPALTWIAWFGIAAVLLWIVYMIIKAFLDREARDAKSSDVADAEEEEAPVRLDELPARVAPGKGGLLDEARRQYEAGNYNLAIVYLYSYQLIKLDQNQMLRLTKGKTNRQYLRELSARPEIYSIVAQTLVPFEDVFFGEHDLTRERFEACWNQVERFNRLVEQAA
jgi:hypothetical protein